MKTKLALDTTRGDFRLCEVPIQRSERILIHPLDTVGKVQQSLSERFFGGRCIPIITVGGRSVSQDTFVLAANCTGVLRLRFFPLKGGGLSLAATEERLRDLLREHGVPEDELSKRVTTLVEKVSYDVCKRCLDSKTPGLRSRLRPQNMRFARFHFKH